MQYLLDTNVISEIRKKQPNFAVIKWFSSIDSMQLYLSCITIGEIKKGIIKLSKTDKETSLGIEKWLNKLVTDYAEQIININLDICEEWAVLMNIDSTNAIDSLLAAQAKQLNMVLVTRLNITICLM